MKQFETTQLYFLCNMIIFTFFYFIPILYQMYSSDPRTIRRCLALSIASQAWHYLQEIIQIMNLKMEYLGDFWNFIDQCSFLFFVFYVSLRWNYTGELLPTSDNVKANIALGDSDLDHYYVKLWAPFMNFLIAFITAWKMMFYMRLHESFGNLVTLVGQVFMDITYFLKFLFGFLVWFTLLFEVLGTQLQRDEFGDLNDENENNRLGQNVFPLVNRFLGNLIMIFRAAIGDISNPDY